MFKIQTLTPPTTTITITFIQDIQEIRVFEKKLRNKQPFTKLIDRKPKYKKKNALRDITLEVYKQK